MSRKRLKTPSLPADLAPLPEAAGVPIVYCAAAVKIGRLCFKPAHHNNGTHKSATMAEACPGCQAPPSVPCDREKHPHAAG